jgi:uncharacterized protein YbbK (DUF523 family)
MGGPIKIGVSSCLLGEPVRYDGGHKRCRYLTDVLGACVTFVPVCPEVGCGLPVPREPMRLEGDPKAPRLVVIADGTDLTERLHTWCAAKLVELEALGLDGFILKERSPSCGVWQVPIVGREGVGWGRGLFAAALLARFPLLPVEEPERLADPAVREQFLGRVVVRHRNRRS